MSFLCQLDSLLSVGWLFVVGLVPTDFYFSNLFAKTPSVVSYRPLSIGRDLRVAGCVMVIRRSFLVGLLNCLGDCDWLFVLGHAMVIRPICLVLCDRDSLVCCLAIFTRFSCCDLNSPVLFGRTVTRLLLRDTDLLGWLDCLLVDSCFLL